MAELVICPRCDRRFDRDMVKDGFAICPYCEEEVEFPVMTKWGTTRNRGSDG